MACLAFAYSAAPTTLEAHGGATPAAQTATGVTRVDIARREPLANGMPFGNVGAYEKVVGTVALEADPADPHNAFIQDLDKAPRNQNGNVEYSADLYIIKPVDMSKGNGRVFYQVNNRGNKSILQTFANAPAGNDPGAPADTGDGWVLREGYTLVWVGWEADVLTGSDRMTIRLPVATDGGAEISGPLTVRFDVARQIPTTGAASLPLSGFASSDSYETVALDSSSATLTVRDYLDAPERAITPDRWAFATCKRNEQTGAIESVTPSLKDICLFDGFDPNQLYQLTYTARNPKPLALGFAATRDVLSFLRYGAAENGAVSSPLGDATIAHVYCWGNSQTGRYVRTFLYVGANEDVRGRRVCDGALVNLAGAQGLDLTSRFTNLDEASQWGGVGLYPRDLFPFSYGVTTDPITGRTDGLLKHPATDPLVVQLDTENEFYQSYASLVTHDATGAPLRLPDSVRYYFMSNAQHTSGTPSTKSICDQPTNPLNYNPFMRAALVSLDRWATDGIAAPPSQYPRADDGTALPAEAVQERYPAIPDVTFGPPNQLSVRNYGPTITPAGGVIATSPGVELPNTAYTVLVPKMDEDGLDVAGLRRPDDVQTPTATVNGWGVRGDGFRAGDLCGLNGRIIPFARTEAERRAVGDPRLSLQERYPTHAEYVQRVTAATLDLQQRGYVLEEDARQIIEAAMNRAVP
jgi:hypothetical protein